MKKYCYQLFLLLLPWVYSCTTANPKQPEEETESILDAYWMLLSLEGQSPQGKNSTRTAYIRFQERENDVKGFGGCNNFFGKYELNGNSLKLSKIGSTRMACPDMAEETKFMQVLERVDSYRITDRILTLYQGKEAIATFRSGNPDELEQPPLDTKIRIKRL